MTKELRVFANKIKELSVVFYTYDNFLMHNYPQGKFFKQEKNICKKMMFISLLSKFYLDMAKFFDRDSRSLSIHDLIECIPDDKLSCRIYCDYKKKIKKYEKDVKKLMIFRDKTIAHNEKSILFSEKNIIIPDDIRLEEIMKKVLVWLVDEIYCSLIEKKILTVKKPEFHKKIDDIQNLVNKNWKTLSF